MSKESSDAIIAPNLSPITLKVDSLVRVTIGDIKRCEVCGELMKRHIIYPYNSPAEKVFVCENKECSQYEKYSFGGRTYGI